MNKFSEMSAMLDQLNFKFHDLKSLNINSYPEENGKTFEENALIKARYYFKLSNMPVITDDSGFCIPALNNQPGILSARFAEPGKNYFKAFKKIELLLQQKGIKQYDGINAYFICYLVLLFDKNKFIITNGKINGKLNFSTINVNDGFGYDPIFIPDGFNKTFAEMSPKEKNDISNRRLS
jgi:XTP/dITP diphosphohydrolase